MIHIIILIVGYLFIGLILWCGACMMIYEDKRCRPWNTDIYKWEKETYKRLNNMAIVFMVIYPFIFIKLLIKEIIREFKFAKGERKWKKKRH